MFIRVLYCLVSYQEVLRAASRAGRWKVRLCSKVTCELFVRVQGAIFFIIIMFTFCDVIRRWYIMGHTLGRAVSCLFLIALEGFEQSGRRLARVILRILWFSPRQLLFCLCFVFVTSRIHSFIVWEMDSGLVSGRSSNRHNLMPTRE
jgi:hypothetical protein